MKRYLAMWYDFCKTQSVEFEANNLKEAKAMAFKTMCDRAGDSIYDIRIFELKTRIDCDGEYNPKPNSWTSEYAKRNYLTGMKRRK